MAVSSAQPEAQVSPEERRVRERLSAGVKRRLGLKQNDETPADVEKLIEDAAHEIVGSSMATAVVREATKLSTPSTHHTSGSGQAASAADAAMLHDAERLAARKKALRIAGFSNEEAMRLLVAEVAAGVAAQVQHLERDGPRGRGTDS
jgi:hypothetical protein